MWVALHGRVLRIFTFSTQHPSVESAILTFAGEGASVEFDVILLPDVIEGCVSDAFTMRPKINSNDFGGFWN